MSAFWHRWLVIWCWIMLGFGAMFAALALPALSGPALMMIDVVDWPYDGNPSALDRHATVGFALLGCVMLGWGTLTLAIVQDRQMAQEPRVWRMLTVSMLVWYVTDSAASVVLGVPLNAVSNSVFLVTFLLPVLASGALRTSPIAA